MTEEKRTYSKRKLDSRVLRDRILDQIRGGHGRYKACEIVGIDTETFRKYYKSNAEFREEVEAAHDASIEPILRMLHDEAAAGDITAAKEWLKHNAPPPRSEAKHVEVKHTHELDTATISSIKELQDRVAGRKAPAIEPAYEEAEVIDDDDL